MIVPVELGLTDLLSILFVAYVYDLLLSEPPFAIHPVVWMGNLISKFKAKAPAKNRRLYGIVLGLSTIFFAMAIAYIVLLFFSISGIIGVAFFLFFDVILTLNAVSYEIREQIK